MITVLPSVAVELFRGPSYPAKAICVQTLLAPCPWLGRSDDEPFCTAAKFVPMLPRVLPTASRFCGPGLGERGVLASGVRGCGVRA
jgi:hypothetical protein